MEIYIAKAGDTLSTVAKKFNLPPTRLASENGLTPDSVLAAGQALLILFPAKTHTVRAGETLGTVAARYGVTVRSLYRNNPALGGVPRLFAGQTLVIHFAQEPKTPLLTNAYAPPAIPPDLLRFFLPFFTFVSPFTCGVTEAGTLTQQNDTFLLQTARDYGTLPLLQVSNFKAGAFVPTLAHTVLTDPTLLIRQILCAVEEKGYAGAAVDFACVLPQDAAAYGSFLARLREKLAKSGRLLFSPVSADYHLLTAYGWGHAYSRPQAIAPLPQVRKRLSETAEKNTFLGIPNYGYDWTLPFAEGVSRAVALSPEAAVERAVNFGAEIRFDETAKAPYFNYRDPVGRTHEVWFEDPRSTVARLQLVRECGLVGVSVWDITRKATANFMILNSLYRVVE